MQPSQSYHSGIEMYKVHAVIPTYCYSQSYHSGIEMAELYGLRLQRINSQSYHSGIEINYGNLLKTPVKALNRTIVELK